MRIAIALPPLRGPSAANRSDGQALAPLLATPGKDLPAGTCAHARAKPVDARPALVLWLKSPFHKFISGLSFDFEVEYKCWGGKVPP